ncbi:hypothetical protein DSL72_001590 [Monilinia vaccinii-corymbosi]|uniref:Uncharacterized protein n=1 Tax=Monilinia vaccinii-corymbosi TaxID=61207 RepID=A0A8A3P7Y3_9HELO|nr:hypothetical protein DSL72_001590 [Monilinia vaccinii-corymbosi]
MPSSWRTSNAPPDSERKASRWPHLPGFYLNLEFKVSSSDHDKERGASLTYTSRNMRERERARARTRANTHSGNSSGPSISTPGPLHASQQPHYRQEPQQQQQQQERSQDLRISTEGSELWRSAPPAINDRNQQPLSPVSPLSPVASPISAHRILDDVSPADYFERPSPSTPGRYRLGGDDLPWSTPSSYWNAEPDASESTCVDPARTSAEPCRSPPPPRRNEDAERAGELSELQQAMMTVDSMGEDRWDPWMWDGVGGRSRRPMSVGWAVSSNDALQSSFSPSLGSPLPPPYVVSQWEHSSRKRVAVEGPYGPS